MRLQQIRQVTLMFRRKMHDNDESQIAVGRHMSKEDFERIQPTRGRPDADQGGFVSLCRALVSPIPELRGLCRLGILRTGAVAQRSRRCQLGGIQTSIIIHGSPVI